MVKETIACWSLPRMRKIHLNYSTISASCPGHASETRYCRASALGYRLTGPPIKATEAWRAT